MCQSGQCASGESPCTTDRECDEEAAACSTLCSAGTDADGDGALAAECGGSDCDDTDPERYPGNTEVCDVDDRDEDCDPSTFGFRDSDGDSAPDASCCNGSGDAQICGTDCDDSNPSIHPAEAESCDRLDNDCDGEIDEGLASTSYYPDCDGDMFGGSEFDAAKLLRSARRQSRVHRADSGARTTGIVTTTTGARIPASPRCAMAAMTTAMDCSTAPDEDNDGDMVPDLCAGLPPEETDCDDEDAASYPGAPEPCDGVRTDCRLEMIPEDEDEDGYVSLTDQCVGGPLPATDCDDTRPDFNPDVFDGCNGLNEDCDAETDEGATTCPRIGWGAPLQFEQPH